MTFLLASGPGWRGRRGGLEIPKHIGGPSDPPTGPQGLVGQIFSYEGPGRSQSVWLCFPSKGLEEMSSRPTHPPIPRPLPSLSHQLSP